MSTQTADYLDAIAHLPPGATLRLEHVTWQDYEQLLADLGNNSKVRVSYDQGRMDVIAPLPVHERYKSLIHDLIVILSEELRLDLEPLGSTTLKRHLRARGAEPDDCFYIQNAVQVIGKQSLDLERDPPPDLVIEIDTTNESLSKFPIYAALGVAEIWRYDGLSTQLYVLSETNYNETSESLAFPLLSNDVLSEFLEMGQTQGQSAARREFRGWVRERLASSNK